ncbi:MAG: hypothetical protein KAX15_07645 [Candidatus Omnitrophica bacterium]|nr:hypothetical protein [Candidatus Omnitrophota bacterium]
MKKWLGVIFCLVILSFVFRAGIFYLTGWLQEKAGMKKTAIQTYSRLIGKYPESRWVVSAKGAIERIEKSGPEANKSEMQTDDSSIPYVSVLKRTKKRVEDIEDKKGKEYENYLQQINK